MSIEAIRSRIASIESSIRSLAPTLPPIVATHNVSFQQRLNVAMQADAPSGVNKQQFATDVLQRLGAPVTTENLRAFDAWISAEGTKAQYNPLATTRKAEGATDFNTVGVKNFVSYAQGVDTTVGAITNGLYGGVIAALRRGDDAYAVADAIAKSPWGSGTLVRQVLESRDKRD